jgi:hypothetical protein
VTLINQFQEAIENECCYKVISIYSDVSCSFGESAFLCRKFDDVKDHFLVSTGSNNESSGNGLKKEQRNELHSSFIVERNNQTNERNILNIETERT